MERTDDILASLVERGVDLTLLTEAPTIAAPQGGARNEADEGTIVTRAAVDGDSQLESWEGKTDGSLSTISQSFHELDELGRGGQAVVVAARQSSLDREVAVKRSREGADGGAKANLVLEGRVTGALSHPNIVPVIDLGTDEQGQIVLILKKIEGETWTQEMRAGRRSLAWHLDVFQQVCRAAHFAHEQGIIHRDLKPSNVMIGPLDEVYVVDWGLAVAIDDHAPSSVARRKKTTRLEGSLGYMPREMVNPGANLDRRTDVYCLGSILYRILAGKAPQRGKDMQARIQAAYLGEAEELPDDVDDELKRIVKKARALSPRGRYPNAEALRQAIEEYLSHESARALVKEATTRAVQVATLPADAEHDALAARLFAEARFGYQQALKVWPDAGSALRGERDVVTTMMTRALARENLEAAEQLVLELDEVPPALEQPLERARKKRAETQAAAEFGRSVKEDRDFKKGAGLRTFFAALSAVGWAGFQFFSGARVRAGEIELSAAKLALANGVLFVFLTVVMAWKFRKMTRNRAGRIIVFTAFVHLLAIVIAWVVFAFIDVGPFEGMAAIHILIALGFIGMGHQDRLWFIPGAVAAASIPLLIAFPRWSLEINGVVAASCWVLTFLFISHRGLQRA